ncbi:MAG: N-acetylmuramoyl-L-alanine amidase AmiA [Bacteroidetes bacterium HLUCCA01]|nr:MAG: N-acetylmuramoyl-L-alanine amidase AmiA [Bacteroidetes bacterium HLUCCA01]
MNQRYTSPACPPSGLPNRLKSLSLLLLILLTALPALAQQVLPRISVATRSDGLGYVLRFHFTSAPDSFKVFQPTADLIQLAVYADDVVTDDTQLPPPGETIQAVVANTIPDGAGFNIQLAAGSYYLARAYPDANQRHLLVALTRASQRDLAILTEGMQPINWNPPDADSLAAADETGTLPDAATLDSLAAVLPETETPSRDFNGRRLRTVIIDAGHGGHDPGAIGASGTREKDIVLTVAKKLGDYINEYLPDVNVVYTRTDDTFIDLHERGRIANRAQGDLFISLHTNAVTQRGAYGAEFFFLGVARTESALEVMKRENSVIALEDPATRTRELTEEELILYELTNVGYMTTSQRLAEKMDHQFTQRAGRRSRGVKQAGFIVLFQASMPAVLVELGFISNPSEERYMRTERGQAILASAMFRAIRDYKVALEENGNY